MNFSAVLLCCSLGIALCAALVFSIETLVAFLLNERETFVQPKAARLTLEGERPTMHLDRAA